MKRIVLLLVVFGLTSSLCAQEMSSEGQKEAMKILEKKRKEILEKDRLREEAKRKEAENIEKMERERIAEEKRLKEEEERRIAEAMKNLTPIEKLDMTRQKAMDRLDFYEKVVRSVEREEKEVKAYEEIMKLD